MASDLLLKFHEGGDSAMPGTLNPFPEILPDGVVSRELEDKPKLLLDFLVRSVTFNAKLRPRDFVARPARAHAETLHLPFLEEGLEFFDCRNIRHSATLSSP